MAPVNILLLTFLIGFLAGLSLLAGLILTEPAFAGPPFITDDPEPVELGHWEVYGFSAGASGKGDTTGLGPSLEVNYGAAPGLQLHLITGMAYDDQPGGRVLMGPSDTELGAKLRFINPDEGDWYPQVGVFPLVEAPTGKTGLKQGARVRHPKYGEGTVFRREGDGDDAKITVQFQQHGVKKLVEKFAQLERL